MLSGLCNKIKTHKGVIKLRSQHLV